MNNKIKEALEQTYHIGFNVRGDKSNRNITLRESNCDKFSISIINKDGIRLHIIAEPETHGASFLKLLNASSKEKRRLCFELIDKELKENTKILVNKKEMSFVEFVDNSENWKAFSIEYNEFPYANNEESLLKAVKMVCGMILSLIDYNVEGYEEGERYSTISVKYERNPINRQICLSSKGYKCVICGFDFEKTYGEVGKNTIEVHHTTPVSKMGIGYIVNPIEELVPVCSNCHTIIHKRKIPYTVEEVKQMISENNIQKD